MELIKELLTQSQTKSEFGFDFEALDPKDYEQLKADLYNKSTGNLNEDDGYNCDECKNKGFIAKVTYDEMFGYYNQTLVMCKCQKIRTAIKRLNKSGLKNIVKDYTFDKYQANEEWQRNIKAAAIRFCKDNSNTWFFIGGQSGSGKTHLSTAIAVHYIKAGKPVRYMLWRDEIVKIKANVNEAVIYNELISELKKAPVLYIDDLFKCGKGSDGKPQQPTVADINAAFEIINYRYNNPDLITIISSERTLVELNQIDEAVAGRIAEKTKEAGYCINIKHNPARNWRMNGVLEF